MLWVLALRASPGHSGRRWGEYIQTLIYVKNGGNVNTLKNKEKCLKSILAAKRMTVIQENPSTPGAVTCSGSETWTGPRPEGCARRELQETLHVNSVPVHQHHHLPLRPVELLCHFLHVLKILLGRFYVSNLL